MMHFTAFAAASEAQRLAEAGGLNLQDLGRLVRYTDSLTEGPGAVMVRGNTEELTPDDSTYESMLRIRDEGERDLTQALDAAQRHSIDAPLATAALEYLADGLGVPHRSSGQ